MIDALARAARLAVHTPAAGEIGFGDERERDAWAARRRGRSARLTTSTARALGRRACSLDARASSPSPRPRRARGSPRSSAPLRRFARPSASPTMGSNALAARIGVSGLSGAASTGTGCAFVWASSRSNGSERRGRVGARRCCAPHVVASVCASAASSSSSSWARSRNRRGSTSATSALAGNRSGSKCSSAVSHGNHDSMPSNVAPFGEAVPLLAAPRSRRSSSRGTRPHLVGREQLAHGEDRRCPSTSTVERWSATENSESRSTSSPHKSMRTGWSAVDGYTSTIEPRTATSPRAFDLVLAAVAEARRAGRRARRGRSARRRATTIGSTSSTCGPSRCTSARTGATITAGSCVATGAQAPDDAQAPAHRLGRGRYPLERQRLPRREQLDRVVAEVLRADRPRAVRPPRRSAPRARPAGARSPARAWPRRGPARRREPRPGAPGRSSPRRRPDRRPGGW